MLEHLSGATRLIPIVGDPIVQVKAPGGVTRALESHGLNAICVPMHVAPTDFSSYMASMAITKNVDGLIITIPHKFAAHAHCTTVSERSAFLRSVNTIRRNADGSFHGDIFDGLALVSACQANGCDFHSRRALVIGAGGAGTAIAYAIAVAGTSSLGIADTDVARRDDLVKRLAAAGFTVNAAAPDATGYDIVVNATPLGMRAEDPLPVPAETLRPEMFVGCVVTAPEAPPFIQHARNLGCRTSNGVAMFQQVRDLMVDFLLAGPSK